MSKRLIILAVVAAILTLKFALSSSAPPNQKDDILATFVSADGDSKEITRIKSTVLWKRALPGEPPQTKAEPQVRVEVDTSGGKNRLYLYISEANGFYMDTLDIEIWHTGKDNEYDIDSTPLTIIHKIYNKFLKANDTLVDCLEVVPAELEYVGGDIGDTQNWDAEIISWMDKRVRQDDPDPLPLIYESDRCDR